MSNTTVEAAQPKQSFLSKLLGIPVGTHYVWWMIGKQRNWKAQIAGFLAFFAIISLSYKSWEAGVAFMTAMYLHEFGHLFFFNLYGIKAIVLLLFPLGAVAAPETEEENKRSDLLPWWEISWTLLAGPMVNIFLMAVGLFFLHIGFWPKFSYQLVFISGALGLFNLIPLGNMDGGQFFHVIFSSLKEIGDIIVASISMVVAFIVLWFVFHSTIGQDALHVAYAAYKNFGPVFFITLTAIGLIHRQGRDKPNDWQSPQAMTISQVIIQISVWVATVISALYLFTLFSL